MRKIKKKIWDQRECQIFLFFIFNIYEVNHCSYFPKKTKKGEQ